MTKELELYEQNYLTHYGVPGMKWGKRKIGESKARTASIKEARGRQDDRKAELKGLTKERMAAKTKEGKQFIDSKIVDKKFELRNGEDAAIAAQRTAGEKWLKAGTTTAVIGASVFGLGAAANAVANATIKEVNAFNADMNKAMEPGYADWD